MPTVKPAPRSMTVGELRELLDGQDDEALVVFTSDYGDHCHTRQVHLLDGVLDETLVEKGAYSDSGWIVASDEDDEPSGTKVAVLVLS